MKISLEKLARRAANRPPGYYEDVLAAGVVKDGWLHLTPRAYQHLRAKYAPSATPVGLTIKPQPKPTNRLRGLGDAIHALAHPAARTIDAVAGTNLATCKKCAQRRAKLNALFPFARVQK